MNSVNPPDPEVRLRSVGELMQLLGARDPSDVTIGKVPPKKAAGVMDVHEDTRDQLAWKPEFFAEAPPNTGPPSTGSKRVTVTGEEYQELLEAGADSGSWIETHAS